MNYSFQNSNKRDKGSNTSKDSSQDKDQNHSDGVNPNLLLAINKLKKGIYIDLNAFTIKEGETTPPKRYTSGSLILAMENAGQLIEDEELRAQIKGSGIGTSATRAEILNKLTKIIYLKLNKSNQEISPTQMGEMVYVTVASSIRSLLNPELTASWEKGLTYVEQGVTTKEEYMEILEDFVALNTNKVKQSNNSGQLNKYFDMIGKFY